MKGTYYVQYKERGLNGWVTICVGTAIKNTLLK
jgi:hypothetical protein